MPTSPSIETTYEDARLLIYKICHQMAGRYYIPFEDVLGQGNLIFCKCWQSYNPDKGAKFTTWLQNKLVWGLTDWLQKEYRQNLHVELNEELIGACCPVNETLHDLTAGLSDEAKIVVRTVLRSPRELRVMARMCGTEGKQGIREVLKDYLSGLGWAGEDVSRAFAELRDAFTGSRKHHKTKQPKALRKCKLTKGHVYLLTRKGR